MFHFNDLPNHVCFSLLILQCRLMHRAQSEFVHLMAFIWIAELVSSNVKRLESVVTAQSSIASSHTVTYLSTVRGICKNHFTCSGSNWIVRVTVGTIVWCKEKKKGESLVLILSSTTGNGLSNVSLCFRLVIITVCYEYLFGLVIRTLISLHMLVLSQWYYFYSGASFCCPLCTQSVNAFHWLAIFFPLSKLQVASQASE